MDRTPGGATKAQRRRTVSRRGGGGVQRRQAGGASSPIGDRIGPPFRRRIRGLRMAGPYLFPYRPIPPVYRGHGGKVGGLPQQERAEERAGGGRRLPRFAGPDSRWYWAREASARTRQDLHPDLDQQ